MKEVIETPYGNVDIDPEAAELGEILISDEGVELEVVGLDPLRLELAPEEDEDWGE
ncbi:MAG: lysine biosynthesis protein LysW [Deinococcota bacterium]|jgi:alpha-aminoadipate carrier protein LysW|nr:lysine biosynthesis protein LysW [Deinococcota bacterium]